MDFEEVRPKVKETKSKKRKRRYSDHREEKTVAHTTKGGKGKVQKLIAG